MSIRSQNNAGIPARPPPPPSSDGGFSGISSYNKPPQSISDQRAQYSSTNNPPPSSSQQPGSYAPRPTRSDSQNQGHRPGPSGSSKAPSVSLEESRNIARTHFDALQNWLTSQGVLVGGTSRSTAREKLTRLTRQQFQELSTDVYDELVRRLDEQAGRADDQPFLNPRPDFHPKRNQARQKLATLPLQRFRDLASDVYHELDRRYPEFNDPTEPHSVQQTPRESVTSPVASSPASYQAPPARPSRAGSVSYQPGAFAPPGNPPINPPPNLNAARRAPTPLGNATGTTNDVVVPNKSTIVIEDTTPAQVNRPSSRASIPSSGGSGGQPPRGNAPSRSNTYDTAPNRQEDDDDRQEDLDVPPRQQQQQQPQQGGLGPSRHVSRNSETSSIGTGFLGGYARSEAGSAFNGQGNGNNDEEREKLKADYEYKLARLQDKVSSLEREVEDGKEQLRGRSADADRAGELEQQLRNQRERYDMLNDQHNQLRADHDQLQTTSRQQSSSAGDSTALRGDLENAQQAQSAADEQAEELRGEVASLLEDLREASAREEQALQEVESERAAKEKAEEEAREWRKKYEQTKTELRNIKATSQLFVSSINVQQDYMPASQDGLLTDVNVTAFQTSIDDLLQAARSKEPSSVLAAVRAVVSAVEKIDQDVQGIEPGRLHQLSHADQDSLQAAKAKINATLSNLMTASKNHAMSYGLSPVSLVDAAASHLSATIVDLVRVLKIRKTSASSRSNGPRSEFLTPVPEVPPLPKSTGSYLGLGSIGMSSVKSALGMGSAAPPPAPAPASISVPVPSQPAPRDEQLPPIPPQSPAMSATSNKLRSPQAPSIHSNAGDFQSFGGPPPAHNPPSMYDRNAPPSQGYNSPRSVASAHLAGGGEPNGYPTSNYGGYSVHSPSPSHGYERSENGAGEGPGSAYHEYDRNSHHDQNNNNNGNGQYNNGHDGGMAEYGSPHLEPTPENSLDELKNYIENQTEAIVHSIQSLLSAIRSGAQSDELNENLTQIITIVSSIVAICRSALPQNSQEEGDAILADLASNCDKLSEMQSQAEGQGAGQAFGKATKQSMASASFGVAKSLKMLNGLLTQAVQEQEDRGLL